MASADFISASSVNMGMSMTDVSFAEMDAADIGAGIDPYKVGAVDDVEILPMSPFESNFDLVSCSPNSAAPNFDASQMTFAPTTTSYQLPDLPSTTPDEQLQLWSMVNMDDGSDHLSWDTPSLQQDSGSNDSEIITSPSIQASTPVSRLSNSPRDIESRSASISHIQTQIANDESPPGARSPEPSPSDFKREPRKRGRKKKLPRSEGEKDAIRSRFLERNRVAASKCREKKKKWVDELETRRLQVEMENSRLRKLQDELFAVIGLLREELARHETCGHEEMDRVTKKLKPLAEDAGWTVNMENLVLGKPNGLEMAMDGPDGTSEINNNV